MPGLGPSIGSYSELFLHDACFLFKAIGPHIKKSVEILHHVVSQRMSLLQDKSRRKLAPRNDLCQEEKAFMFNWNLHMRNHPVHADAQASLPCFA